MTIFENLSAIIAEQQKGHETKPRFMIGEQLKEIAEKEPLSAELLERDLLIKEMNLEAAKLIEQQRDELIKQEYTLTGVMYSVDKWLDGDELEQDEVNRAITMREKTLRIIETIKTDTAKAIFEEIDEGLDKIAIVATNDPEYCGFDGVCRQVFEAVDDVLAELKKKYTEVSK